MRCGKRRLAILLTAVLLPALALGVIGIGGEGRGNTRVPAPQRHVLRGKITLKGSPDLVALTKKLQEAIAAKVDQRDYCLKGSETEKTQQEYRIGDNKLVGNVFVWVQPERGGFYPVSDKQLEEAKKNPVVLRQPHCAFIPHCAILFARYHKDPTRPRKTEPTGQYLLLKNDAEIAHNVNFSGGAKNPGDNLTFPPKGERKVDNLVPSNEPIRFRCNIHNWMSAHLWVLDTPYYAISYSDTLDGPNKVEPKDPKFGTYEIKNVPPGKARIFAWHEATDWLSRPQGDPIDIAAGTTDKDFELTVK